jgi:D-alanine-D-alanine ligase
MVKLRVAVLMGGDSAEREISLLSGRAVAEALDAGKYEVAAAEGRAG